MRLAADLARRAGELIVDGRRSGAGTVATKSTTTDLVTEYDRASRAFDRRRVRTVRPDDGIIGEEGTSDDGTSGVSWLIDPIDGTTNFFYGLPGYAVSIAAQDGGHRGRSGVHPGDERTVQRRTGQGALNGDPIRPSSTSDLRQALVATGFSYQPQRRREQMHRLQHIIGEARHPPHRRGCARPLLCRCRSRRRVLRRGSRSLGPRRR